MDSKVPIYWLISKHTNFCPRLSVWYTLSHLCRTGSSWYLRHICILTGSVAPTQTQPYWHDTSFFPKAAVDFCTLCCESLWISVFCSLLWKHLFAGLPAPETMNVTEQGTVSTVYKGSRQDLTLWVQFGFCEQDFQNLCTLVPLCKAKVITHNVQGAIWRLWWMAFGGV